MIPPPILGHKKPILEEEQDSGPLDFPIGSKGYIGTGEAFYSQYTGVSGPKKDFWEYDLGSSITLTPSANRYSLCPHYLWLPVTIRANAVNSDVCR